MLTYDISHIFDLMMLNGDDRVFFFFKVCLKTDVVINIYNVISISENWCTNLQNKITMLRLKNIHYAKYSIRIRKGSLVQQVKLRIQKLIPLNQNIRRLIKPPPRTGIRDRDKETSNWCSAKATR